MNFDKSIALLYKRWPLRSWSSRRFLLENPWAPSSGSKMNFNLFCNFQEFNCRKAQCAILDFEVEIC